MAVLAVPNFRESVSPYSRLSRFVSWAGGNFADLDPAASNMTAISYYFYCFLIIDQKKSDIMCIHTSIYIHIDVSFIYQPPRSFLSTHSSKASLNFSSVISTPFFQSSQLVVPVGVASRIQIHRGCDNSNATCVWHKNLVLSQKKKMLVRNPMFVFAVCPHFMVSDTLTSPAGNLFQRNFFHQVSSTSSSVNSISHQGSSAFPTVTFTMISWSGVVTKESTG